MSEEFVFLGNSITDRTNRITLVKLVAQRLGIDRKGYVEFYLLSGNIVIRKGEKNYDPNNGRTGFYMGSSIVDKDNRITLIKLVVQNLQIDSKSSIDFFLFRDEIVIRESVTLFQSHATLVDVELLSDESKEFLLKAQDIFINELESIMEKGGGISPTKFSEIFAKVQEEVLKDVTPQIKKTITTSLIQTFHLIFGPEEMKTLEDKTIANFILFGGGSRDNLKNQVELMKRSMKFVDRLEEEGAYRSERKKKKILEEVGLERAESGKGIQIKK